MSVAVDVVDERIREPIKFLAELKAVLLPSNHKFWYLSNRQYVEKFILVIKEVMMMRMRMTIRMMFTV